MRSGERPRGMGPQTRRVESAPRGNIDSNAIPTLDNAWIEARTQREQSILRLILTQDILRAAVTEGPIVNRAPPPTRSAIRSFRQRRRSRSTPATPKRRKKRFAV